MHRRKKAALLGIAALSAIGLALPGTAAARSFAPLQNPGVPNTSMVVIVQVGPGTDTTGTVSWGDVSWGDNSLVG